MTIKFDTIKQEELAAHTHRVFGKIALGADKNVLKAVLAALLTGAKEGSAKVNDLLRIADAVEAEIPGNWRPIQEALIKADAELEAKQRLSAAESRKNGEAQRRLKKEQEARDAEERAEFERWKRSHGTKLNNSDAPKGDPNAS